MPKPTKLDHTTLHWVVSDSVDACGPMWRALQQRAIMTAFQRYEWQNAWSETIGRDEKARPVILAGIANDDVKILFALNMSDQFGAKKVSWLAADWCDYAMPLISAEFANLLSDDDVDAIWRDLLKIVGGVDCLLLEKQPLTVDGYANPFARYKSRDFTAKAYALKLGDDWDGFYANIRSSKSRRRMREKENRLKKAGGLTFRRLTDHQEIGRAVSTMLDWKVAQIVDKGMFNPFASRTADNFLAQTVTTAPDFARFYSLDLDGEMLAGSLALVERKTFTIFQTAYGQGPHTRCSPGRILIDKMMETAIEEGLEIFDFSLGDEPYKLDICDIQTGLTQSARAFTAAGWLPTLLHAAKSTAKVQAKSSQRLSRAVFAANRAAYRLGFSAVGRELPTATTPARACPTSTEVNSVS